MSINYLKYKIKDFLRRFYNIVANVTKVDDTHICFDLGYIGSFILNVTAFKTDADITAFTINLSSRINTLMNC